MDNLDDNRAKAKKFMELFEQLPRMCSPTICGTLSQPTTKSEREKFEWSLEQKALLSPANITTDDWQDVADLNQTWLQQESDVFFSQKTIAPSPMTPATRIINAINECDTSDEESADADIDVDVEIEQQNDIDESDHDFTRIDEDTNFDDQDDDDTDIDENYSREDQDMDNLFFSPQPLRSSQTQQRVDIFSPETFVRVMEDENTLQSTPKTIGSQLTRVRTRTRNDMSYYDDAKC